MESSIRPNSLCLFRALPLCSTFHLPRRVQDSGPWSSLGGTTEVATSVPLLAPTYSDVARRRNCPVRGVLMWVMSPLRAWTARHLSHKSSQQFRRSSGRPSVEIPLPEVRGWHVSTYTTSLYAPYPSHPNSLHLLWAFLLCSTYHLPRGGGGRFGTLIFSRGDQGGSGPCHLDGSYISTPMWRVGTTVG